MSKPALIVLLALFVVFAAACKRSPYYSCYCYTKGSNGVIDSIHAIGKVEEAEAYRQCTAHYTANDSCIVQSVKRGL